MTPIIKIEMQQAVLQGHLDFMKKLRDTDPETLLELNKLVQEAALKVIESQNELIAQQNAKIAALDHTVRHLGNNSDQPKSIELKMEDDGKEAGPDIAVLQPKMRNEQKLIDALIRRCDLKNLNIILEEHSFSGENLNTFLDFVKDNLDNFVDQLKYTFYNMNSLYDDDNYDGIQGELPVSKFVGKAKDIGRVLMYLTKQKYQMNPEQKKIIHDIIKSFKESTTEEALKSRAKAMGYSCIVNATRLVNMVNQAAMNILFDEFNLDS